MPVILAVPITMAPLIVPPVSASFKSAYAFVAASCALAGSVTLTSLLLFISILLSTSTTPVPFASSTRLALLVFVVTLFPLIVTSSIIAVGTVKLVVIDVADGNPTVTVCPLTAVSISFVVPKILNV